MDSFNKLTGLLNEYFDYVKQKKHINIIVLGGYSWSDHEQISKDNDNYKKWNNKKQCDYSDMENYIIDKEKENIFIKIKAVDPSYPYTKDDILIPHYKAGVTYDSVEYLDINAHNIIVTFYNRLLPTFYNFKNNNMTISTYNEYKIKILKTYNITYISNINWQNSFPTNIIDNIIKYNILTPVDIYDWKSYNYMINIKKILNDNNITDVMLPYMIASFNILNTLMVFDDNEKNNKVIKDLLNNLDLSSADKSIQDEINNFIFNTIKWNRLNVNTRKYFCNLVFNEELCMQQP